MTKAMHSTTSRRQTPAGTAGRQSASTENAPAQPGFIDPTGLPDEYAMRVRGDCLAPAINGGDAVLVDQRQPYAPGDLVCVYLKAECSGGSTNTGLKRLVMNMMPGVTYPFQAHPDSNVMPVLVCEQDNPPRQYTVKADQILAVHRCMGLVPDDVALYDPATGEPEYRRAVVSAGWSRRELLAGAISVLPATGLAALPVLAADEPDPIFAAIEAHRAAVLAFDAAVEVEFDLEEQLPKEACRSSVTAWNRVIVETDDPRWIAALDARHDACEAADDMAWDLIEQTPPVTAAGAAALLHYADGEGYGSLREGWFPDNWHQEAYRAIAMTSIRLAGGAA